jgi:hypothetical protein
MNPVMSSAVVTSIHESMLRDAEQHRRYVRTSGAIRHSLAVALVALGNRLDPSLRRPASQAPAVPAGRLGLA